MPYRIDKVGDRVKFLRTKISLSQSELAEELEVHKTTISKIESGDNLPSLEMLVKFATFFGVSTDALCKGWRR